MTDRDTLNEWPDDKLPHDNSVGLRRRIVQGLDMQQIEEPVVVESYSGIGTELRAERQRRQITLFDVSNALRIQQSHLAALEEGRVADLPGATYATGFLRTYSDFLGLDGEEIVRQYKSEGTLTHGERRLVFLEPEEEARRPGLILALISLIVAGAVYGGWIFLERQGLLPVEIVAEPPRRLAPYQVAEKAPEPELKTAPASTTGKTTETKTSKTNVAAVADKTQSVSGPSGQAIGQATIAKKVEEISEKIAANREPGEGERAAAADVTGLANTMDKPVSGNLDVPTDTVVTEVENAIRKPVAITALNNQPAVEEKRNDVSAEHYAVKTRQDVARPAIVPNNSSMLPKREGSEVETAPVMPAIQVAVAPPPPPAAPTAPVRPLSDNRGEPAYSAAEGRASLATASEGLSYRPQAYGASNRDARVVLRARAESWVQVQGANNELLLTRMLRPGDSYHAPNRVDLVLMTGNAGAIEVMVDGEAFGALGPVGQIRRNIKLNADYLRGHMHSSVTSRQ